MEHLKRLGFAQLAPAGYIKQAATPSKALEANRDGMRIKQRRSLTHAATEIADKTQITVHLRLLPSLKRLFFIEIIKLSATILARIRKS